MNSAFKSAVSRGRYLGLGPEEMSALLLIARQYQHGIDHLSQLAAAGRTSLVRTMAGRVLQSRAAIVCAVLRTAPARSMSLVEAIELANIIQTRRAYQEIVTLRRKGKPNGGTRPIMDFGPRRRALQKICDDIIKATLPKVAFEYLEKKRGTERLVLDLVHMMNAEGYKYVLTADIRNCFGSVRREELGRLLPLPLSATQKVLLIEDDVLVVRHTPSCSILVPPDEAARRGLPQGALTSGRVMSRAVLGPTLATTEFSNRIFLFGDNISVPVRDRPEGEAILRTVSSRLQNGCGGPLTIGYHQIAHESEGIQLVKYCISRAAERLGGRMRIRPAAKCYQNYSRRVTEKERDGASASAIEQYKQSWIDAFPLWEPNETSLGYLETNTELSRQLGRPAVAAPSTSEI